MKKYGKKVIGLALLLSMSVSMTVFAGTWKQDSVGWWYQNDNGNNTTGWNWINGKCYYFDSNGYMLANTTTPDGYNVDANGAWIVNGVVQTQGNVATQANTGAASGYNKEGISNIAIDLLHSSREEANAKYGPEYASPYFSVPALTYSNTPFGVAWDRKQGHEVASQENPKDMNNYYIKQVSCKKPTDMVNFLPERANSMNQDDLAKLLKSMGYDAVSSGLTCKLLLGDYYIQFRNFDGDTSVLISSTTAYGKTPKNTKGASEESKNDINDRPMPALSEKTESATTDTNTNAVIINNKP